MESRTDLRTVVAAVFALLVTLGAVAGAWWFLFGAPSGPTREELAAEVAAAYAEAWSEAEWAALSALMIEADEDVARLHAEVWDELEVIRAEVDVGDVTVDRGRADASLVVELTLAGLGPWAYEVGLVMLRHDGEWRVEWEPAMLHPELTDGLRVRRLVEEPTRAPILAHDGTALTEPGLIYELGVHPERIEDADRVADAFELAGVSADEVHALLARPDLRPDWFYPLATVREGRHEEIWPELRPIPGILFRSSTARVTPTEGFARHVVGVVGPVTAELLEELGDPYQPGDAVGLFGLERVFEVQLAGSAAAEIVLVEAREGDEDGPVRATLHRFDPNAPEAVETTLDVVVQAAVEEALEGLDARAAFVVLDTETSAIRAVASRPLGEFNRAFAGLYPPGSAFKVVTAAALLGDIGPDDPVTCPAQVSVGGLSLRNAGGLDLGDTTLADAFAWSCNTTFGPLGADATHALDAEAERFGFGTGYDLPLDAAGGRYPEPADRAEVAAAAIGQARVQSSPLHLASVAAAVASGQWRPPYLLDADGPGAGRELDPQVRDHLETLMLRVVSDGTGGAAAASGGPVAGKTGSAEITSGGETHAWFIGFRDGLAFAVLVEAGGSGGEVAAPVAARFLEALERGREEAEDGA